MFNFFKRKVKTHKTLLNTRQGEAPKEEAYQLSIPEWVSAGQRGAMDSAGFEDIVNSYDNIVESKFLGNIKLSEYSQNPLILQVHNILSEEMTKAGFRIIGDSDEALNRIEQIEAYLRKIKFQKTLKESIRNMLKFGSSQLYIKLKDDDASGENNATIERELPLYIDKLKIPKGSLEYFKIVEPVISFPIVWNASNPLLPDYYNPTVYSVMGITTHATRLIKFINNELDHTLRPMYLFQGMSLTQLLLPTVLDFQKVKADIRDVISRMIVNILKTDMKNVLSSSNDFEEDFIALNNFRNRVHEFVNGARNFDVLAIDKEEEFQQIVTQLGTLDKLLSQYAELVASIARIPVSKLLGQSIVGLNSSGEHEERTFADMIEALNQSTCYDNLITVINVVQLHLFGDMIDLNIEFNSIFQLSHMDKATIHETKSREAINYYNAGILTVGEIRQMLSDDNDGSYNFITPNEDISGEFASELNHDE